MADRVDDPQQACGIVRHRGNFTCLAKPDE
jgi:hypothetical protein